MIVLIDATRRTLALDDHVVGCEIGRAGAVAAAEKREGDGATPLGRWPVRGAMVRPGREFAPPAHLPWRWIRPDDGWCDDPGSASYNRPISLPSPARAERMWRDDGIYDALLVLGYNDAPPASDRGSAIFVHLAGVAATAGCVAVDRPTMVWLLQTLTPGAAFDIRRRANPGDER